ncbi:protein starmaker-like isoform X2 [Microplitis mediator]|uniref:protein starmaker-like isoform X2 n=1 Tax=Microplitis mediator TaxID=375433 RepID=UPI002552AB68|nr:protein starmaker-like isoform X2 [Microplitis mediator]
MEVSENPSKKIKQICRICFIESINLTPVFSNHKVEKKYPGLIEKIRECGGIQLREERGIPFLICDNCIENAKIAYKFRLQCQHSETRLQLFHEELIQRSIQITREKKKLTETTDSISGSEASKLVIDEDLSLSDDAKSIDRIDTKNDKVDGDDLNSKKEKETDVFRSLEALAHHSFNDHGEKYKCFWCPETFDTLGLMKIHKKIHDRRSRSRKISDNGHDDSNVSVNEEIIQKSKFESRIEKTADGDHKEDGKNNPPASDAKIIGKKESRSWIEDDIKQDNDTETIKTKGEKRLKFKSRIGKTTNGDHKEDGKNNPPASGAKIIGKKEYRSWIEDDRDDDIKQDNDTETIKTKGEKRLKFKSRIEKTTDGDHKEDGKNNPPASDAKIIGKKESRSWIEDDRDDDVRQDDDAETFKTKREKRLKFKSRIEKTTDGDHKDDGKNNLPASDAKIIGKKESRSWSEDDRDDDVRQDNDTEIIKMKGEKRLKICHSKKWIQNFILHKCDICQSTFETEKRLNTHKRSHIAKNICNLCNRAFTSENWLQRHKQSDHSSNKTDVDESRVCFFCNKVFASSSRRFIHEKKIHWEIR